MKKFIYYIVALFLVIGVTSCHKEKKADADTVGNTTVEEFIKQDKAYFANMAGKNIFYESRVVLDKPFNEADKFVAVEVTNVFQQNMDDGNGNFTTSVYEFKHVINYSEVDIQIHKGTFVLEDEPINTDTLKLTFEQAFTQAKKSDLIPSKSRYVTLRNPLGPVVCAPQYIIGNDNYGVMFVDAVNGKVSDKNPAF